MTITGTVPEWENWPSMALAETGHYVVPEMRWTSSISIGSKTAGHTTNRTCGCATSNDGTWSRAGRMVKRADLPEGSYLMVPRP